MADRTVCGHTNFDTFTVASEVAHTWKLHVKLEKWFDVLIWYGVETITAKMAQKFTKRIGHDKGDVDYEDIAAEWQEDFDEYQRYH